MSDYPPPLGYGAYQPPYYPPHDSRNAQPPMAQNYDMPMSGYGYNNAMSNYNPTAVPPGVPSMPSFQAWNQDTFQQPAYTPMQNGIPQWSGYVNGGFSRTQANVPYYAPYGHQHQQPYHPTTQAIQGEVRDVSEGEFDGRPGAFSTPQGLHNANQYQESNRASYPDTAHHNVHAKGNDYVQPQALSASMFNDIPDSLTGSAYKEKDQGFKKGQGLLVGQSQSFSHSPFLSPNGTSQGEKLKANGPKHGNAVESSGANKSNHVDGNPSPHTNSPPLQFKANGVQNNHKDPESRKYGSSKKLSDGTRSSQSPPDGPVAEARKKAEGAVFDLWSYDVRLPSYAGAGLNQKLVENLFDNLKLPKAPLKSAPGGDSGQSLRNTLQEVNHNTLATLTESNKLDIPPATAKYMEVASAASKQNKEQAQVKADAQIERERTLHLKMEALRKSREERAQKTSAKNSLTSPTAALAAQKENLKPQKEARVKAFTTNSPLKQSPSLPQRPSDQHISGTLTNAPAPQISTPAILGLFRSSSPVQATLPPVSSTMMSGLPINPRKRPVAADLYPPSIEIPTKRPFGHSRSDQALVIDVSGDEEEDVAMDLDSQGDASSPVDSVRKVSDQRPASFGRSKSDNQHTSFVPPSATGTPPFPQSILKPGFEHIQKKQNDIEVMKKKIAELEKRKNGKASRQGSSGAQTPQANESNGMDQTHVSPASSNTAPTTDAQRKSVLENRVASERVALAKAQAEEETRVNFLIQQEAERKRLRREKIAGALPFVDQEIEQKRLRIEELSMEKAQIEAALQKHLADKELLNSEMEKLARETDDQLQLQKAKLKELTKQADRVNEGMHATYPPEDGAKYIVLSAPMPPESTARTENATVVTPRTSLEASRKSSVSMGLDTQLQPTAITSAQRQASDDLKETATESQNPKVEHIVAVKSDKTISNQELEAALQEAVRAETVSHEQNDVAMADAHELDARKEVEVVASSPEEGEATPDVVGAISPEYSPVLGRDAIEKPEMESDNYEPPEATPPAEKILRASSPAFSSGAIDTEPQCDEPQTLMQLSHTTGDLGPDDSEQLRNATVFKQTEVETSLPTS